MSTHSERPEMPPSFTGTEPVPSIGNPSSDLHFLPKKHSSSNATLYGPDEGENTSGILCQEQVEVQAQDGSGRTVSIDMLPDNVFLEIFDQCRKDYNFVFLNTPVWGWHRLVHVCRRWRQLVFGSPRRLDLRILCTNRTPVRETLDFWPPFYIAIQYSHFQGFTLYEKDGLSVALSHRGRIRHLHLDLLGPELTEVATLMQESFPELIHLTLRQWDEMTPALSSGFLGGSAPCLQYMHLEGITFPALPTLLSSASKLVVLNLDKIPPDGYISPEAMVTCLAMLPRLKFLSIGSQAVISDGISPPPVTRTLLPALTSFDFEGISEYLEDFLSRIDSPRLSQINVEYNLFRLIDFQVTQLFKFIDRSDDPEMTLISHADVDISPQWISFDMYLHPERRQDLCRVTASIYCRGIEDQVSHIAQVFRRSSAMLSRVAHLKLSNRDDTHRHNDTLLGLLRQFPAVRTLHVSQEFAKHIALALEDVTGEMISEVLPVLDLIYLGGQPGSSVEMFLSARRLSDHPVTIVDVEAEFYERVKSYVSE